MSEETKAEETLASGVMARKLAEKLKPGFRGLSWTDIGIASAAVVAIGVTAYAVGKNGCVCPMPQPQPQQPETPLI